MTHILKLLLIQSLLISANTDAAVTTYTTRSIFEAQVFTVTTSVDFSNSQLDLVIGDTVQNRFTNGMITISSNVREGTEGAYSASIKGLSHPDRYNNSNFAALQSYGSLHPMLDLRSETATILLTGTNQVFGLDLGSFAEQTTAFFRTNLGNNYAFTGTGVIGSNLFAGAISNHAGEYFTRIDFEITGVSTTSDGFGIDNLVAGAIPEPSTLIFLTVLPVFLLIRKRV